ncbi:MAG: hypothetical protein II837_04950 [Treponema sp.]|nr:hypothetical protein [Treponema sp.]
MTICDQMEKAVDDGSNVRVVCNDGKEYAGEAVCFTKGDDEDDGFASFCVRDPNYPICLSENEIKSIEVI